MGESRDQLLQHYTSMRADFLAAIEGLSDEEMAEPSLDGWSISDHLAHLALWDELRASEVERISAGHASAWKMSGEQDNAFNELLYQVRRTMTPQQARWEFRQSRDRLLAAIQAASERGLDPTHYGEAGLRSSHEAQHAGWIRRWRDERAR